MPTRDLCLWTKELISHCRENSLDKPADNKLNRRLMIQIDSRYVAITMETVGRLIEF